MCEVQAHYVDQDGNEQGALIEEGHPESGTYHLKVVYWKQKRTGQVRDVHYSDVQQVPGTWHWAWCCQSPNAYYRS